MDTFIVLINYNNHKDTIICLSSICEAGYGKNVIVVDNNSMIPGVDKIQHEFPDIVLIKNKENVGFGRANNIGIRWAINNTACKYIFILNNDTTITKDTIPCLEAAISQSNSLVVATSKIVMMNNSKILWYGGGEIDWKKCSASIPGYLSKVADNDIANKSRDVTFASGCAMLIKRTTLVELGGFDDRFFMYVEDLEFCIRIHKKHLRIIYVANSLVYHKCQGSQKGATTKFYSIEDPRNPNLPFFLYNLTKNRVITVCKHASASEFAKFLSYYPLSIMAKSIIYFIHKRFDANRAILKGLYHGLLSFRKPNKYRE